MQNCQDQTVCLWCTEPFLLQDILQRLRERKGDYETRDVHWSETRVNCLPCPGWGEEEETSPFLCGRIFSWNQSTLVNVITLDAGDGTLKLLEVRCHAMCILMTDCSGISTAYSRVYSKNLWAAKYHNDMYIYTRHVVCHFVVINSSHLGEPHRKVRSQATPDSVVWISFSFCIARSFYSWNKVFFCCYISFKWINKWKKCGREMVEK